MARPVPSVRSSFGDTTFTKIFVGGLAWETQSSGLRAHFQQFGEILEAVVIIDKKTGRSKGYGFVTFRDPDAARRACLDPNPVIERRRANCNLASSGHSHPPLPAVNTHPGDAYFQGFQAVRPYVRRPPYLQSFPYRYQQGLLYSPYGYGTYGSEYPFSHGHGPPVSYRGYQYPDPGNVRITSTAYPFIHLNHSLLSAYGYDRQEGSSIPDQDFIQIDSENAGIAQTAQESEVYFTSQSPSSTTVSASSQSILPAHGEQQVQGAKGSDDHIA